MSVKITELPILDSLADNDIVAGVDVSGNTTSKIELGTLKNYIDTNTQYTAGTNIDITNNVISAPDVPTKEEFDSLSTIFNAFPTESDEDESMTLDGTAEVKFKKFDLEGNTSQGNADKKNKITFMNMPTTTGAGLSITPNNSELMLSGTPTGANPVFNSTDLKVSIPAGTYTFSLRIKSGTKSGFGSGRDLAIYLRNGATTNIATITIGNLQANNNVYSQTFTISESANLYLYAFVNSNQVSLSNLVLQAQLESGSTMTDYVEYSIPTPTTPIPINVVSGDNEINVVGKNLLNIKNHTLSGNAIVVNEVDDYKLSYTTSSSSTEQMIFFNDIELKAGVTYTAIRTKASTMASNNGALELYQNLTWKKVILNYSSNTDTFTVDTDGIYRIRIKIANSNQTPYSGTISDIMISTIGGTYEPYQGNTYNIDLGVENKFNKDQWYNQRSFLFGSNRATMSEDGTITSILPSAMDFAINLIPPMSATATQTQIDQVNATGFDISNLENITISLKNANSCKGQILALFYKADYGYISIAQQDFTESNVVKTFGVPSNAKYLCLRFDNESYNTTPTILKIEDIQIEAGTKANSYTPYGTTPIELCKIGNYQDYIYKDSGKWYLHKETHKHTVTGVEGWSMTYGEGLFSCSYESFMPTKKPYSPMAYSNYFVFDNRESGMSSLEDNKFAIQGNYTGLFFRNNSITSVSDFRTWLSTHNTTLYYVLATPTNTEITYQPLIDQLNELEKAISYEGQTNISQVSNDKPFILDVTAIKSLQSVLDRIELLES